jgi:hypothetical protein
MFPRQLATAIAPQQAASTSNKAQMYLAFEAKKRRLHG